VPKIGHDHFNPRILEFIIHLSFHSTLCDLRYRENVVNKSQTPLPSGTNVVVKGLTLLLLIGRSEVQTSARRPVILIKVFVVLLNPSSQIPG
jgi:hypothetical protein